MGTRAGTGAAPPRKCWRPLASREEKSVCVGAGARVDGGSSTYRVLVLVLHAVPVLRVRSHRLDDVHCEVLNGTKSRVSPRTRREGRREREGAGRAGRGAPHFTSGGTAKSSVPNMSKNRYTCGKRRGEGGVSDGGGDARVGTRATRARSSERAGIISIRSLAPDSPPRSSRGRRLRASYPALSRRPIPRERRSAPRSSTDPSPRRPSPPRPRRARADWNEIRFGELVYSCSGAGAF